MGEVLVKQIFRDPESYLGRSLKVSGWVRTLRVSKSFGFIELNDGSFFQNIQVVFDDKLPNFQEIAKLPIATALRIEGELVESPGAKQPWELKATAITIDGRSEPDYPLQKKRHSLEYLRTIAHLRPRSNTFSAVFRVRSLAAYAIHRFFQERNFVYVHTPIITGSDCEGRPNVSRFDP